MTDTLTKEQRSWVMGRIRGKNTKPEIMVRSLLHRMGYRFRINRRDLPGRPDIVLPKYRTVVFVHGCFWHRHPGCRDASMPKTRRKYWRDKFAGNVERDKRNARKLRQAGWSVLTVWSCQVKKDPLKVARHLDRHLRGGPGEGLGYEIPSGRELLKAAEKKTDYHATTKWSHEEGKKATTKWSRKGG